MNSEQNTNTFIHNIIEDFQQDLSGNPRMQLLNNIINIIQGNRLNENVSMLPLASNIILPQQSQVRSLLRQSLFEKNLYKNVLSEDGEKEIQKINYKKNNFEQHSCCISFEEFKEGEEIYKLPCGHIFSNSIFTWLKEESNKCPVCRYELSSKEIKNEDYLVDISSNPNTTNRQIPINPFQEFLDNMRNVYNNPRPLYRQNASENLGPIFHRTPFSVNLRNTIQEFEYDREYQNAILASIQEFDGNSDTINSLEHENDIYTPLDVFDEMVLENISSDSDSDSDNDPMNQVD